MKTFSAATAALVSFVSLALAQNPENALTLLASKPGSSIHLQPLVANSNMIWIGKETGIYCPTQVNPYCPSGNATAFVPTNNALVMSVEVPGGQSLHVMSEDGALTFNTAHTVPKNLDIDPGKWQYIPSNETDTQGFLNYQYPLYACPTDSSDATYQVFAGVPGTDMSQCLTFSATTTNVTNPASWQYI